jgi:hypothetical protein
MRAMQVYGRCKRVHTLETCARTTSRCTCCSVYMLQVYTLQVYTLQVCTLHGRVQARPVCAR